MGYSGAMRYEGIGGHIFEVFQDTFTQYGQGGEVIKQAVTYSLYTQRPYEEFEYFIGSFKTEEEAKEVMKKWAWWV